MLADVTEQELLVQRTEQLRPRGQAIVRVARVGTGCPLAGDRPPAVPAGTVVTGTSIAMFPRSGCRARQALT